MIKFLSMIFALVFALSCSSESTTNKRTQKSPYDEQQAQIKELTDRVNELSLFASTFTAGVTNEFADCNLVTLPLEKKMCQIAQTATATQQLELKSQLAIMAKEFQTVLFGDDCTDAAAVGCPVVGSIKAKIAEMDASIATNTADIASINTTIVGIQASVTTLAGRVTTLEGRLNNVGGTGKTIETLISEISTDIVLMKADIATIKGTLANSKVLEAFAICGDNASSGPIYETLLLSGDRSKAFAYVKTGTADGLGLFFSAGNANAYYGTNLNTRKCQFKMYNNAGNTAVQACWISTNRSATAAQIDAARTASTATCTPF
jgi:hypothetical protein